MSDTAWNKLVESQSIVERKWDSDIVFADVYTLVTSPKKLFTFNHTK